MKRIRYIFAVLILILVSATGSAVASSRTDYCDLNFEYGSGIDTIIFTTDGGEYRFSGILNIESVKYSPLIDTISSYSLIYGEDEVFSVQLHDMASKLQEKGTKDSATFSSVVTTNGYCSLTIDNLGNNKEAFITGLTTLGVSQVQNEIVNSLLSGNDFDFKNVEFIDTEKNGFSVSESGEEKDSDWSLCWAAATSNILHYTGWGTAAGFSSVDYIFESFIDAFDDEGGNTGFGVSWFFNGVNPVQGLSGWAQVDATGSKAYGSFKGYLQNYPYENYCKSYALYTNPEYLQIALDDLKKEYGIELGVGTIEEDYDGEYEEGTWGNGHAITLWGYVKTKNSTAKSAYTALIISDSDSDISVAENRRLAENQYSLVNLTPYSDDYFDTYRFNFTDSVTDYYLGSFTELAPYKPSTKETGTGDRFVLPDFSVSDIGVDTIAASYITDRRVFTAADELFINPIFENNSEKYIDNATINYKIEIYKNGVQYGDTYTGTWGNQYIYPYMETNGYILPISIGKLPEGSYEIVAEVNYLENIKEANYSNNTNSIKIKVYGSGSSKKQSLSVTLNKMNMDSGLTTINSSISNGSRYIVEYRYRFKEYDEEEEEWYTSIDSWEIAQKNTSLKRQFYTYTETASYQTVPKVEYRILVKPADKESVWTEYVMDESQYQSALYYDIYPYTLQSDTTIFTPVSKGATKLYGTESINVSVGNWSSVSGNVPFKTKIVAISDCGLGTFVLEDYGSWSLNQYNSVDCASTNSLDSSMPADKYFIYAIVTYNDINGKEEYSSKRLGSIVVKNASVATVTTNTVESIGNFYTTFEVSSIVTLGTEFREGIQYRKSTTTEWTTEWANEGFISAEYMNYSDTMTLNLEPGQTYYYRSILEYKSGSSTITINGSTKSCTTGSNQIPGILQLGNKYSLSLTIYNDGQVKYYKFTPSASGYYLMEGKGSDFSIDIFDVAATEWEYLWSNKGKVNEYRYFEAGKTYYIGIYAYETGIYNLCVSKYYAPSSLIVSLGEPKQMTGYNFDYKAKVSANVALGNSYLVGVEYWNQKNENYKYTSYFEVSSDNDNPSVSGVVRFGKDAGTIMYRAFIKDKSTGNVLCYSETKSLEVQMPDTEILLNGSSKYSLDNMEEKCFELLIPESNGTSSITVSGPDGEIMYWDAASNSWKLAGFTNTGITINTPIYKGKSALIKIKAFVSGEYNVYSTFNGVSGMSIYDDKLYLSLYQDKSGSVIAGAYDTEGKMTDVVVCTATVGSDVTLSLKKTEKTQLVRLFYVDGQMKPIYKIIDC